MTSLPGLHGGENGGEEVAGGNATQQPAIAYRSPGYPHTRNNKWFYFYLCDFLFPSGQSIWLQLSINILLQRDKANESFNCCGNRRRISGLCLLEGWMWQRLVLYVHDWTRGGRWSWAVVTHGGMFKTQVLFGASDPVTRYVAWVEKLLRLNKTHL